jgi:predicted DNA-binding transcriptional regulator AlpA
VISRRGYRSAQLSEVCMRPSESSEMARQDDPLRPAMLQEELLRLPAVIRRVGLRKTAIYEKIRRAEFPKLNSSGARRRWDLT